MPDESIPQLNYLLAAAAHRGDFAGEVVFALGEALAHLVAREAADGDALARLGDLLREQLVDGLGRVLDERLVEEHRLLEELVEAALDDLLDDLLGVVRVLRV